MRITGRGIGRVRVGIVACDCARRWKMVEGRSSRCFFLPTVGLVRLLPKDLAVEETLHSLIYNDSQRVRHVVFDYSFFRIDGARVCPLYLSN